MLKDIKKRMIFGVSMSNLKMIKVNSNDKLIISLLPNTYHRNKETVMADFNLLFNP